MHLLEYKNMFSKKYVTYHTITNSTGWVGSILGSFPIILHVKLPSIDPTRPVINSNFYYMYHDGANLCMKIFV